MGTLESSGVNFAPPVSYYWGAQNAIIVSDINGDGKADVIIASACMSNGCVAVLLGNGDGTFQPAVTYASGGYSSRAVAVADINGDGKPDLIATNECLALSTGCATTTFGTVGVLLGNGDGTFQTASTFSSGGYGPIAVVVGDVNGDGKLDVLVGNWGTGVTLLLGNGDGTLSAVQNEYPNSYPFFLLLADVNNDGKLDLLVATGNDGVAVLLGNGDGSFQTATTYSANTPNPVSLAIADLNGDGKLDVAAADSTGSVNLLIGNGDGTFQQGSEFGTYDSVTAVTVSDVNGDGYPDVLAAGQCFEECTGGLGVFLGNGTGGFPVHLNFESNVFEVAAAELNGDSKIDVLTLGSSFAVSINQSTIPTSTAITSVPNPAALGQTVTFTATVTKEFGEGTPTGTVNFFDISTATNLGSSSIISSGVANFNISTLGPSAHSVTATYVGDTNFGSSTSAPVSQVVLGAAAKFSATNLSFGNQTVAMTSAVQTFTLTNIGDIPLTFNSITITGMNPANFAQTNTCGSALAGQTSCVVSVSFKPSATGTRSAAVTFSDNAPSKVQKVHLTGVGVLPEVMFSPTSLSFPRQVIYTTSAAKPMTLTNIGLGVLNISELAISTPFQQTNNCGASVSPGASCTLTVTFHPTAIGTLTGAISVYDNAPASPQKVGLIGVGTAVQLSLAGVNFGNQPTGTTSLAKTITLSNKSHATVNIVGIAITGTNAGDFREMNTCGTSVAAGASCFVKVKFTPSATGKRTASISINDNGGGSPQKVGLAGTGT